MVRKKTSKKKATPKVVNQEPSEQPKKLLTRMKEDDYQHQFDQLLGQFKQLKASVVNSRRRYEGPNPPVQRFYRRQNQLDPEDQETYRRDRRSLNPDRPTENRCFRCGKPGHFRVDCPNQALSYNDRRDDGRLNRVNVVEHGSSYSDVEDEDWSSDDEEYVRPRRSFRKTRPRSASIDSSVYTYPLEAYPTKRKIDEPEEARAETPKRIYKRKPRAPRVPEIDEQDEALPDVFPTSESMAEESLRTKKDKPVHTCDVWDRISQMDAKITIQELVELSPTARGLIKNGVTVRRPRNFPKVNAAIPKRMTPAYASGSIEKNIITFIIDTGAGLSLLSQVLLDRFGWSIDEPTTTTVVVADGGEAVTLGIVRDVPVTFGNCTITIDMVVTQSTSYDVILGVDWLKKANALLDLNAATLRIDYRGVKQQVPLDLSRGI